MTSKDKKISWNSDAKIPNGKPESGFTINTGINEIHNERPVSPFETEKEK